MDDVRQVVGQDHLPGIQQTNIQSFEHGPEHLVMLQRVPVAVGQRLRKRQCFEVCSTDDDQRTWSPVQQAHHRPADALQPLDVESDGEGAEVRPDAKNNNGVDASN